VDVIKAAFFEDFFLLEVVMVLVNGLVFVFRRFYVNVNDWL
jgi:hypothetical protein